MKKGSFFLPGVMWAKDTGDTTMSHTVDEKSCTTLSPNLLVFTVL